MPTEELLRRLEEVYDEFNTGRKTKRHQQRRNWFAFNMTDWLEDLENLYQLYSHPDRFSKEEASDIVSGFVIHAPHHLIAAARLLLGKAPRDIFYELEEGAKGEQKMR